ncbi:MAG: CHASE2 domain-containing protein [Acidiferrobacterales bacterium]
MLAARKIGFILAGVVLLILLLYVQGNQLLDTMELKTYDMRLRAQGTRAPAGNVVIAAIDEKSLATLGRWPWSRHTLAEIIRKLDVLGARVIALDAFFPESENAALLRQIAQLEAEQNIGGGDSPYASLKQALATDVTLGEAIAASGKVILSMVFLMSEDEARQRPVGEAAEVFAQVRNQAIHASTPPGAGPVDFPMIEPAGLVANLPELRANARYTGHINSIPDVDGTLRWAPLIIKYRDLYFPSADVQAVRAYRNGDELVLRASEYGVTGLSIGEHVISTDESGRALIHYHGPEQTITTFSIADLFSDEISSDVVRDNIVLVGATAKGIGDIRVTPFGPTYPGVEIRANTIQNLLDGDFVTRPGWMLMVDALVIITLGALLSVVLPRIGMWTGAGLVTALFVAYIVIVVVVFRTQLVWLNIVYPSVLIMAMFVCSTIAKYLSAETGKRQIKSAFQHYVPATVVDQIIDNIDHLRLGGEKRALTVLFSDIRGFTSVSQSLPPENLVRLLNIYLTQMTEKVFKHDGLLDKYVGDAIMAVYGAPIYREDHAVLACRTALDMLEELPGLQKDWRTKGLPALDIGIGINTGPMVVGNMGSKDRFDYTVIGDAVNLGSRIEELNKTYGTNILMSEFTYECVRSEFPYLREIDLAKVRGRREPVKIYELMQPDRYPSMDWLSDFRSAYSFVHQDKLDEALRIFEHLDVTVHDPVSRYYVRRANRCLSQENV